VKYEHLLSNRPTTNFGKLLEIPNYKKVNAAR